MKWIVPSRLLGLSLLSVTVFVGCVSPSMDLDSGSRSRARVPDSRQEAHLCRLDRGWEVWREAPSVHVGYTRYEVRELRPEQLSDPAALATPEAIRGAELSIGGRVLPFAKEGDRYVLDLPDRLAEEGNGTLTVFGAQRGHFLKISIQ